LIPSVSVVIVNYNNLALLRKCLNSIVRSNLQNYEIIVVDNNSTETGVGELVAGFSGAKLILLPKNIGYAAGSNRGIQKARGEYVLLLNNDAELTGYNWGTAIERFQHDPQLAALQPKIIFIDEPLINNCGLQVNILGFSWNKYYRQPIGSVIHTEDLAAFSGAAVMMRKSAIEQVGLFDDRYFMYHEDVDLSCRLRRAGWKIQGQPNFVVAHHYSYKRDPKRYYYLERNRLYTVFKTFPISLLVLLLPVAVFMEFGMLYFSITNHWFLKKIQSYFDVIVRIPAILRLRHITPVACSSKDLIGLLSGQIAFEEVQNPLLDRIANPVLLIYRRFLKKAFSW
jgi:GT2 family glycosyltransferase